MIPTNIEREHIIKAIREIDSSGIPPGRKSRSFFLTFDGKRYPPKYVVSSANKFANGEELNSSRFNGGQETNNFLKRLGFDIVEISSPKTFGRSISSSKKTFERTQKGHNERCSECKKTIERMLKEIHGNVESNYKFEVGTHPEDFIDTPYYDKLKKIYEALQNHRDYKDFVRSKKLDNVDYFIPEPGFIVEFDESQHFSELRRIALRHYPDNFQIGFDKEKWIKICKETDAKDNAPLYRDEQRAWYDTLRDFLPELKGLEPTVRLYSKEMQWCSLNPENPENRAKFRELIENRRKRLSSWVATKQEVIMKGRKLKNTRRKSNSWVATVVLQSNEEYSNCKRLEALSQIVDTVTNEIEGNGVILFPGGWFSAGKQKARNKYEWVEGNVKGILSKKGRNIIICLGIDGRETKDQTKDQIGIAISKNDIEARGRKFYAAPGEEGYVKLAEDYKSDEEGKSRIFDLNGRKYFLCACYDCFGIRKKGISNFGIDVILDLVHGFGGDYGKGAPYFARHGFAGASKEWDCLVFGAAVFFHPIKPKNWPSGVYWNQGNKSTKKWKYKDNPIKPQFEFEVSIKEGVALVRIYNLEVIKNATSIPTADNSG